MSRRFFALMALAAAGFATFLNAAVSPELAGIRYEQAIGAQLPLAVSVRDNAGTAKPLSSYFGTRAVVLIFGYTRCPQLCAVVANGTVETLRRLVPSVGRDYEVLYVSIDPTETARDLEALVARDVGRYGRAGASAGWHAVAGAERDVARIASAAGFHFTFDARTRLYAHPSGFVVVTPQGVVSRYFLGVDFDAADVATAIRRAQEGKTGLSTFDLLLVCARGNGVAGRYGRIVWIALDGGVVLTVGGLLWGILAMVRAERRKAPVAVAVERRVSP